MREELKPCPFCGGKARLKYCRTKKVITPFGNEAEIPKGRGYWVIGCNTFDCILYYNDISNSPRLMFCDGAKKLMIEKWNRRAKE